MRSDAHRATPFERIVLLRALLIGLPATAVAVGLLLADPPRTRMKLALAALLAIWWVTAALSLGERIAFPLRTVSNLLSALRGGDYAIRGRGARAGDALGEVFLEVNALGETLKEQRLGALEASALVATVLDEIDVAVFAFDPGRQVRLANRAAGRLMARPAADLMERTAAELDLAELLGGPAVRTVAHAFPGGAGRYSLRRSRFREHGLPHDLLVVSDLSLELREEERNAWQRLVRVLSHELNNSLTPIKSIAGSLQTLLARQPRPEDADEDARRGLSVIEGRAESLRRFVGAYAQLAKLPKPQPRDVPLGAALERVARLETRLPVSVAEGPPVSIQADPDQLEQMLINLVRNAVDASLATGGAVRAGWTASDGEIELFVADEGPGLPETANLFVPFFTTKPGGSGIGLALCRQIAEAHGGSVTLANRAERSGCVARVTLPRA